MLARKRLFWKGQRGLAELSEMVSSTMALNVEPVAWKIGSKIEKSVNEFTIEIVMPTLRLRESYVGRRVPNQGERLSVPIRMQIEYSGNTGWASNFCQGLEISLDHVLLVAGSRSGRSVCTNTKKSAHWCVFFVLVCDTVIAWWPLRGIDYLLCPLNKNSGLSAAVLTSKE